MREQLDCEIKQKKLGVCLEQHHHIVLKKHNQLENLEYAKSGHTGFAGLKKATTEEWNASDYIPLESELIVYTDYIVEEDKTIQGIKVGDGVHMAKELPFADERPYLSLERLRSYLYKITFDTIAEDEYTAEAPFGGCTSFVRNGKLYRSYDWNYDNAAEFIVKCPKFEGMSMIMGLNDGNLDKTLLGQLPYHIVDGRNEHGIMVSTHVLYNDWEYAGAGEKNVLITRLPYLILNSLESMDDIQSIQPLLDNIAIPAQLAAMEYLLQFVITDGTTTYIITPPENATGSYILQNATAMPKLANFRWVGQEIVDRTELQRRPTGVERWNLIDEDTKLEDLRFTKAYEEPTRLSEFIGLRGTTKDSTDEQLLEIYNVAHGLYLDRTRNGDTWQSVHAVIYSKAGMEFLAVQEDYNINYAGAINPDTIEELHKEIQQEVNRATQEEQKLDNNKVDKEEGKGLSTNDYTDEDKEKLGGIAPQATKVVVLTSTPNGYIVINGNEVRVFNDQELRNLIAGKETGWVIDTQDQIIGDKDEDENYTNVTAIESLNLANIKLGDNVYIKDADVPDYWVSGRTEVEGQIILSLNTLSTKIDLSNYYTKQEVQALLANVAKTNEENTFSEAQTFLKNLFLTDKTSGTYIGSTDNGNSVMMRAIWDFVFRGRNFIPYSNSEHIGSADKHWSSAYINKLIGSTQSANTDDIINGIPNVINASDIINNTLTQAQYDLITNGKPTLIKGVWGNRKDSIIKDLAELATTYRGVLECGNNNKQRPEIISIVINKNTKGILLTENYLDLQVKYINNKTIPSNPTDYTKKYVSLLVPNEQGTNNNWAFEEYTPLVFATNVEIDELFGIYPPNYFCIENAYNGNNDITFVTYGVFENPPVLEYSFNRETWTNLILNQAVTVPVNGKMYVRGNNDALAEGFNVYTNINSTQDIKVSGNIMSLLDKTCELMSAPASGFVKLFDNCITLLSLPLLPATNLERSCYTSMFNGCTKIKLSRTKTDEYQNEYRIPASGTGTAEATSSLAFMFSNTGGPFTGALEINTIYYTSNEVIK